jgi:hypothetical protein
MFAIDEIADFKCEAVTVNDADHLRVSIAVPRGRDPTQAARKLQEW